MEGIKQLLAQKYGGLPGWAWAAVVAVGAWWVLPRLTGGSRAAPAPSASTAGPGGYSSSVPSATSGGTTIISTPPGPTTSAVSIVSWNYQGTNYWAPIFSAGQVPASVSWSYSGQTFNGTVHSDAQDVQNVQANAAPAPLVFYYNAATGQTVYTGTQGPNPQSSTPAAPGIGTGSRRATIMEDHHPMLKGRVIWPHYVRSRVGGAGRAAHLAELHTLALKAGVHPARLIALNPHPTDTIRIA